MATIAVLGTLDTKGHEHAFVAERIRGRGHDALLIDVGTGGEPAVVADIPRAEVAAAAGIDLPALLARGDRGECVTAMAKAAPRLLERLVAEGRIQGAIALGGGGGTAIASAAMRMLPIGFPKLLVSTLASGNTAPYVGTSDLAMMPAVVDVQGLNRISRTILARAAGAICGMVEADVTGGDEKPLIVASMFGNTTKCIEAAIPLLEAAGYEVLVFHATGTGGRAMEALIASGLVAGVLDVTTTELADELVGGVLSAGPERLDAAAKHGVPAVIAPGCLDMVNFGERHTVPERHAGRNFYIHNPQVTLMRTTPEECAALGRLVAEKVNASRGPVSVLIPRRGISVISAAGGPFHSPAADAALFGAIERGLRPGVACTSLDCEINDPAFARACVEALLANITLATTPPGKPESRARESAHSHREEFRMPQVKHYGVFQFKPEISSAQIATCFREMAGMVGKIPGLLDFHHGPYDSGEGMNDGFTHGFIMTFASPQARDEYLPHPEHERVKAIVVPCLARVIVFDFNMPEV